MEYHHTRYTVYGRRYQLGVKWINNSISNKYGGGDPKVSKNKKNIVEAETSVGSLDRAYT